MNSDSSTPLSPPISRRAALKGLGGLAAGWPLLPGALSAPSEDAAAEGAAAGRTGPPAERAAPAVLTSERAAAKPNILWITGEGVPLSVLSCYGSTTIEKARYDGYITDNITKKAIQGIEQMRGGSSGGGSSEGPFCMMVQFFNDHRPFDPPHKYEDLYADTRIPEPSASWAVSIDNAPTMLDLAGAPVPEQMQGRSLRPLLAGETPADWRTSMYYHYYEFGPPHWVQPNYGIRTERYKLIHYYTLNEWELFDLQKDPDEMESLFEWGRAKPGYAEVASDLAGQLKQLRTKYKDGTGLPVRLDPTRSYD